MMNDDLDDDDDGDDVDEDDDDDDDDGNDVDKGDNDSNFDIDYNISHSPPRNVMFWLKMSGVKFLLTTHTRPQWKAYLDIKVLMSHHNHGHQGCENTIGDGGSTTL